MKHAILLWIFLFCGCNQAQHTEIAKTWPVRGSVVQAGQPLTAGSIEFLPKDTSGTRAVGEIDSNGTFSLFTFAGAEKVDGAIPGEYRVTVTPPIPEDQNVQIFSLSKTFTVEEKENDFTIDVSAK